MFYFKNNTQRSYQVGRWKFVLKPWKNIFHVMQKLFRQQDWFAGSNGHYILACTCEKTILYSQTSLNQATAVYFRAGFTQWQNVWGRFSSHDFACSPMCWGGRCRTRTSKHTHSTNVLCKCSLVFYFLWWYSRKFQHEMIIQLTRYLATRKAIYDN